MTRLITNQRLGSCVRLLLAGGLLAGCGDGGDVGEIEATGETEDALGAAACGSSRLSISAASASSTEAAAFAAGRAIDQNMSTRWSSQFSDPQWLRVDLGAPRFINRVVVHFERASSKNYTLQVSNNGTTWTTIYTKTNNPIGPVSNDISGLNAKARYLRLHSTARTTQYGVSIYELEVYGDSDAACAPTFRIDSVHSGKTLDVKNKSTTQGAFIQQWTWFGTDNQKWVMEPTGDGRYEIKSVLSGMCLDVRDVSTANGARLQQWPCHGGSNQRFHVVPSSTAGQVQIKASHSGKCLDVKDFSTADGGVIQQWSCTGNANQRWTLTALGGLSSDPNNCGAVGHSCFGGACVEGLCEGSVVVDDLVCGSELAVDAQNLYVADEGNIFRYGLAGQNKATAHAREGDFNPIQSLVRDGTQLFFSNETGVHRHNDGATSGVQMYEPFAHNLSVTGSTVVAFDYDSFQFVSFDRNLSGPGAFSVITTLTDFPGDSTATSAFLYYTTGSSAGTVLHRVDRATGTTVVLDSLLSIGPVLTFGQAVYWRYFDEGSNTFGVRRLAEAAGSSVQEAVPPAVGVPMDFVVVDASGIYHSFSTAAGDGYYRTLHTSPGSRTLFSRTIPSTVLLGSTADSIYWLDPCFSTFGGIVSRLAKP